MNIKYLKDNNKIIFEHIAGSHAYGTNIASSDEDIRGIFKLDLNELITFRGLTEQCSDEKNDITYYELGRFFKLAAEGNPNIIEEFYHPEDCIRICTPIMQKVLDNRHLFISKIAKFKFGGYAYNQIKKAKGENKWINRGDDYKEKPNKEDFCWLISLKGYVDLLESGEDIDSAPFRPIKITDYAHEVNLNNYHAAQLEHVPNVYRLYYYGEKSKGIFRDGQIVCESIPFNHEWEKLDSLLIYNEQEYEKAMKDYHNYNEWKKNRNDARWIQQESGEIDYDCKNMMHCIRLLLSGANILINGEPIVRFSGEQLQFLKDIRAAKFKYEYLIKYAEDKMLELDSLYTSSTIPHHTDVNKIDQLYKEIMLG
jgi:uncharacterized protein